MGDHRVDQHHSSLLSLDLVSLSVSTDLVPDQDSLKRPPEEDIHENGGSDDKGEQESPREELGVEVLLQEHEVSLILLPQDSPVVRLAQQGLSKGLDPLIDSLWTLLGRVKLEVGKLVVERLEVQFLQQIKLLVLDHQVVLVDGRQHLVSLVHEPAASKHDKRDKVAPLKPHAEVALDERFSGQGNLVCKPEVALLSASLPVGPLSPVSVLSILISHSICSFRLLRRSRSIAFILHVDDVSNLLLFSLLLRLLLRHDPWQLHNDRLRQLNGLIIRHFNLCHR